MSRQFKVGDRVKLREGSIYWGQSEGSIGIIKFDDEGDWLNLSVKWAAGKRAYYNKEDLYLSSVTTLEDHLKEFDVL